MNICVLTHTYPRFSGDPVAPFMQLFCEGLLKQGHKIFLLVPDNAKLNIKSEKHFIVKSYKYIFPKRLHLLGYSQTLVGDQKLKWYVYLLAPLMIVSAFIALFRLARKKHIDIISAHWVIPNGFIGALVSKMTGIPLVITVPGSDLYLTKKNSVFHFMSSLAIKQARALVSNSMRYLEVFPKIGIPISFAKEIPYGIDVKTYQGNYNNQSSLRKKLELSPTDLVILAVGRLVEKKGFAYLVKAMGIVAKKNRKAKLVIVGSGSQRQYLVDLARKLAIEKQTVFVPQVPYDELPNLYRIADLYVAPSIEDSHGNFESHIVALIEAIAAGLPIVATKLAVSSKYVVEGVNGYRVDERDEKALASAIIAILNNPSRTEMGKRSAEIGKKYLSYESTAKEYLHIFQTIVGSS